MICPTKAPVEAGQQHGCHLVTVHDAPKEAFSRRLAGDLQGLTRMVNDIRFKRLEKAKFAGLSRDFVAAYSLLDELLAQDSRDVEARRLYGNLCEMEAFGISSTSEARMLLKSARCHYRRILDIDAGNLYALFDMAEQMVHFGRFRCATRLYDAFLESHRERRPDGYDEELSQAREWLAGRPRCNRQAR
jgi:hypothetical protein